MKQCLLATVVVMFGFVALLVTAGTVIAKTPDETVVAVWAAENPTESTAEEMTFPYTIPDTTLTIRSLALYEGDQLEIDSKEYLVDAAALEVENHSDQEVAAVYIAMAFAEEEYHFYGTNLPVNSSVLLVEMDGKPYITSGCSDYTAWVRYAKDEPIRENVLSVTEVGNSGIRVENISQRPQEDILLYHKNYLPDADLYLGGVTYQTYIGTLLPGESVEVKPFRYVRDYSKIIKAAPG